MGKKKKDKGEKKEKLKNVQAIDERVKRINAIQPPDENPWKMENENKIMRWRPISFRNDRLSIAEEHRKEKRQNRPKKKQPRFF